MKAGIGRVIWAAVAIWALVGLNGTALALDTADSESVAKTFVSAEGANKDKRKKSASKGKRRAAVKGKGSRSDSSAGNKTSSPLDELKLVEGDERGNEIKSLKAELLVSKAETQAINQAIKLLKKHKGTPLEPELEFRLAELYMRRSKTDRFFEVHRESDTVVKLAPRMAKEASTRDTVTKAVEIYAFLQNKFPDFGQMDLVIFNHAFARQILGQEKEAEGLYQHLIAKYMTSPLIPDAHLAMGELAFNKGNFTLALDHFNAVKKFPESRVYPYGLYKAAWTYYNMHDAEKGLKKLEEVVAYGKFVAQSGLDARLDLRKEALNDMTLFYEDVYPAKEAYRYFREQAGVEEVGPILLKMATLYERHSRFADQRVALQEFIDKLSSSPLLPKVNTDLILAYDHLRDKDHAVGRLEEFSKLCRADGSWVKGQGKTSQERAKLSTECSGQLNDTALRLAKKWLKAWKKLPSDTTYADASEKAFEIYLRTPANADEYLQSRYAYADLLFSRQKYRQASEQYALVSRAAGGFSSGKGGQGGFGASAGASPLLTHDASYGAILSLEKAVGDKWSGADEANFQQLAREYIEKNPQGQYRLDLEYKMAILAYEKERYNEAAPVFLRLGSEYPKQEKGRKSQDLYLDILNIKKNYGGARKYAAELLKIDGDPERASKIHKLYEQAYFLEIQSLEEKGQLKQALVEYQNFSQQNPQSDLNEKAVWNAMQLQYKLGDTWNGALTSERFATRFPASPQAENSLLRAAQTFEQMGQLSDAARVLEKLAARDPKSAARWKELAADFYALDRHPVEARRLYEELKVAAHADAAAKAKFLGKLESVEKNYGSEESHGEIMKLMVDQDVQPQASIVRVEAVESLLKKGSNTEAFNEARRWLGSSHVPRDLKGRLRLVQAKVLEQEFVMQSVKSRAERVGTVLALKTEKLQKAQEAFQDTIKFGNAKASQEAFEHLYGCYSHYVKALKEMPVPVGLSAQDAQGFRDELDRLVVPLEEKSVDTLAQAVQFAKKQNYLDDTVTRLERELSVLNKQSALDLSPELSKPQLMLPVVAGVGP